MNKVDLVEDQWYYYFKSNEELNIILLTLNVFAKHRFKIEIKQINFGYFYNGYIHFDATESKTKEKFGTNWFPISLDYILNYVP